MSSSNLKTTFTTDDTKLLASYEKLLRKQQQVLDQAVATARLSKRHSDEASRGAEMQGQSLNQGIASLGRMAAGYASLRLGISLVNGEIQKQIDLQSKAGQAQRALANPRASLLQNLGDIPPAELRQVKRKIDDLSIAGFGKRDVLTSAFGELASATPNLTNKERGEYLEVSAKFSPDPEQLRIIAAGLGDTSGLTKSKNPLENLGVMAATAAKSRGTEVSMVAENIMPVAKNLLDYGASVPESLALPVAIQNETVDKEGRKSGTSALQVGEQLQAHFKPQAVRERVSTEIQREGNLGEFDRPNEQARQRLMDFMASEGQAFRQFEDAFETLKRTPDLQEKFFDAEVARRTQGATKLDQQIAVMQRSPEEFAAFAKDFHGEEKQKGAVLRLLGDPNSDIARQYEELKREGIPAGEEAAEQGRRAIKKVQQDPNVATQRLALAQENTADKLLTDNFRRGEAGAVRDGLRAVLESVNTRTVEQRAFMDAYNVRIMRGDDPIESAQKLLRKKGEYLTDPTRRDIPFLGLEAGYEAAPVDPERLKARATIERLDAELSAIKEDLAAGREAESAAPGMDVDLLQNMLAGGPTMAKIYGDEFDLLRHAPKSDQELAGHAEDLDYLRREAETQRQEFLHPGAFLGGAATGQPERPQTSEDKAMVAMLDAFIETVKKLHASSVAVEKKLDEIKGENQTANRQAGARASRATGKE